MTKTEIATLVIASGLAAGLVSGLVTLISGRWERSHRTKERKAIEEHEARLRRELAHDQARAQFLPIAEQFVGWAYKYASDSHWEWVADFTYIGTNQPAPSSSEDVLDCLRKIMYGHPSKAVRDHAHALYNDINNQWTEIVGDTIPDPTFDQTIDWWKRAKALIELIHTPETVNA